VDFMRTELQLAFDVYARTTPRVLGVGQGH
jgi:hypothetical protein